MKGDAWNQFKRWKSQGLTSDLVAGAWVRKIFVDGWHHTDYNTERVFKGADPDP